MFNTNYNLKILLKTKFFYMHHKIDEIMSYIVFFIFALVKISRVRMHQNQSELSNLTKH